MKKGMTLVELIVAILCMTVMMGVVYQLIVTTERIQIHTGVRAEAEYNIREAMDLMLYEIQHAGYRYYDSMTKGEGTSPPICAGNVQRVGTDSLAGNITISADLDESGTVSDNEIISYQVNNNTLERRTQGQGWEMVANNVENVRFNYFDEDKQEIVPPFSPGSTTEIRRIDMAIRFAYPVRGEAKTLTTTLNTSVYFRNTYNFD
jgi:type II secretory pathway component PulJ